MTDQALIEAARRAAEDAPPLTEQQIARLREIFAEVPQAGAA